MKLPEKHVLISSDFLISNQLREIMYQYGKSGIEGSGEKLAKLREAEFVFVAEHFANQGNEASDFCSQAYTIRSAALGIGARYLVPRKARPRRSLRRRGNAQTIIIN